jgi:hypothetical protein
MTLFGANSTENGFDGLEDDRDRLDQRLPAGDPLAIFHRLPEPAVGNSDISAMKAAVAELRRAREISRRSDEISGIFPAMDLPEGAFAERPAADKAPSRRQNLEAGRVSAWRLPAAAAALFATALFFSGSGPASFQPTLATADSVAADAAPALHAGEGVASHLPLVEDLDPRQAELIQIEDDGLSLVVVLAAGPI